MLDADRPSVVEICRHPRVWLTDAHPSLHMRSERYYSGLDAESWADRLERIGIEPTPAGAAAAGIGDAPVSGPKSRDRWTPLRATSQKPEEPKFGADEPNPDDPLGAGLRSGPSFGVITAVFAIGVSR